MHHSSGFDSANLEIGSINPALLTNISIFPSAFISTKLIERKHEARFLGVIVDESLNWSKHIKTLQSKMSRYIDLMYKLKKNYPNILIEKFKLGKNYPHPIVKHEEARVKALNAFKKI